MRIEKGNRFITTRVQQETTINFDLCINLLKIFQEDLELNKQGRTLAVPFPTFHNMAWNTVAGIIVAKYQKTAEINKVYVLISQANRVIEHLNNMKPGMIGSALNQASQIRIQILKGFISWIKEFLEPEIRKSLQLVSELGGVLFKTENIEGEL